VNARTVTVRLADGTSRTVPEPGWCLGRHADGLDLVDLMHEGPENSLEVATRRGAVTVMSAALVQNPYATSPEARAPRATVLLPDGWVSFSPAGLSMLADGLVAYAGELRLLAAQLGHLVDGEVR
jgi:hypothetical protein